MVCRLTPKPCISTTNGGPPPDTGPNGRKTEHCRPVGKRISSRRVSRESRFCSRRMRTTSSAASRPRTAAITKTRFTPIFTPIVGLGASFWRKRIDLVNHGYRNNEQRKRERHSKPSEAAPPRADRNRKAKLVKMSPVGNHHVRLVGARLKVSP